MKRNKKTEKKDTTKGKDFGSWHEEGRDDAHTSNTSSTNHNENAPFSKKDTEKEEGEEKLRNRKASWD